jgi:hypothetical protein
VVSPSTFAHHRIWPKDTTAKMILQGTTKTLTVAVTKSNRRVKCPIINGAGHFIYLGTKK